MQIIKEHLIDYTNNLITIGKWIGGLLTQQGRQELKDQVKLAIYEIKRFDKNDYKTIGLTLGVATVLAVVPSVIVGAPVVYFGFLSSQNVMTIAYFYSAIVYGTWLEGLPSDIKEARGRRRENAELIKFYSKLNREIQRNMEKADFEYQQSINPNNTPDVILKLRSFAENPNFPTIVSMIPFRGNERFFCCITRDIMINPITAAGHNYEQKALAKWYDDGNTICPLNPSENLPSPYTLKYNEELAGEILELLTLKEHEFMQALQRRIEERNSPQIQELRRQLGIKIRKNSFAQAELERQADSNKGGNTLNFNI